MLSRGLFVVACFLLVATLPATGRSKGHAYIGQRNNGPLILKPVKELAKVHPEVIEGNEVTDPEAFPGSFFAAPEDNPRVPRCTATLVGPRALITAAHCVGNGSLLTIVSGAVTYSGQCFRHPRYPIDSSADLALCALDESPTGIVPERVAVPDSDYKKLKTVLLGGYGCTNRNASGGNDGVFRIGAAKVREIPGSDRNQPYYFTTEASAEAPAVICSGDSGGAAFCMNDPAHPKAERTVCGIISGANCLDWVTSQRCGTIGSISYLTSFAAAYKTFPDNVSRPKKIRGLAVCGLDKGIDHLCRNP